VAIPTGDFRRLCRSTQTAPAAPGVLRWPAHRAARSSGSAGLRGNTMGITAKLRAVVNRGLAAALVAAGVTGAMALGTGVASASEGYYGELHYDHGEWSYYYHGSRYHGRDKCDLLRDTDPGTGAGSTTRSTPTGAAPATAARACAGLAGPAAGRRGRRPVDEAGRRGRSTGAWPARGRHVAGRGRRWARGGRPPPRGRPTGQTGTSGPTGQTGRTGRTRPTGRTGRTGPAWSGRCPACPAWPGRRGRSARGLCRPHTPS
jgi:hypothetical protein